MLHGAEDALLEGGEGRGEEARAEQHLQAHAGVRELAERVLDGGEHQGVEPLLDLAARRQLAGDQAKRSLVQPAEAAERLEPAGRSGRRGDHLAAVEEDRAAPQVDPAAGAVGGEPAQQLDQRALREVAHQRGEVGVRRGAELAAEQHQQQAAGDLRRLDPGDREERRGRGERLVGGIGAQHHEGPPGAGEPGGAAFRGMVGDPRLQRFAGDHDHRRLQPFGETARPRDVGQRHHLVSRGGEQLAELPQAVRLGIDQQHGGTGRHGWDES